MMVIKNQTMPKSCDCCENTYEDFYLKDRCNFTHEEVWDCKNKRHKDCPFVCELPEDAVGIIGVQKGDTNLDVLKAAFSHTKIVGKGDEFLGVNFDKISGNVGLRTDWCDAPYEGGKEK